MPENPTFRKSSYSSGKGQNCVEVADFAGGSAVRDTQHRHLAHVTFTSDEWHAFLEALKHDQL
ncbi:DUF397 domain-containing protein [Nocardiopsis coralliicola]